MANSTAAFKTLLAATAPLGLCTQLLLSAATPVQAQPNFLSLAPALNAAVLKANSGAILGAVGNQGVVEDNAPVMVQDSESAANERIRMAELAAQREQAQLQAQAQQTQGWIQLGVGLLGSLLQSRQQAAPAAAPQPDVSQLQQLIQEQQAQIQALQQQQQQAQAQPAQ